MTVPAYMRIYRDKDGRWKPRADICQCDPDDFSLWGLIKKKEKEEN